MISPNPETVIPFPTRQESAAEASDRLLLRNSLGWVGHFVTYADKDTAVGIYRELRSMCATMERDRGFGKK